MVICFHKHNTVLLISKKRHIKYTENPKHCNNKHTSQIQRTSGNGTACYPKNQSTICKINERNFIPANVKTVHGKQRIKCNSPRMKKAPQLN